MLGTSWECHKVREFALRPMGDFLLVLDRLGYIHHFCIIGWFPAYKKSILEIQVTKTTLAVNGYLYFLY